LSWKTQKRHSKTLFNDNEDLTKLLHVVNTAMVVKGKYEIMVKIAED